MSSNHSKTSTVAELKSLDSQQKASFESILILRKKATKTAKNGSDFLSVELGDKTGSFHLVCFSNNKTYSFFNRSEEGSVIRVGGHADYYQDRFSPQLQHAEKIPPEALSDSLLEQLVEITPEDPSALWDELQGYVEGIGYEPLRETVKQALADEKAADFRTIAAAISMHHAYRHGLLEHTVRICRICQKLLPLYPEVDADLAMSGVILHDIGKSVEYTGDLITQRTRKGILQGHVVLGYRLVRKAALLAKLEASLLERLEHIILSHQGQLEWGAAAMAATPEAVFVSMIDNLDAKMGMVQHALRTAAPNEEFSPYLPGLETRLLTAPIRLPSEPDGS